MSYQIDQQAKKRSGEDGFSATGETPKYKSNIEFDPIEPWMERRFEEIFVNRGIIEPERGIIEPKIKRMVR